MDTIRRILEVKGDTVFSCAPDDTVMTAVEKMCAERIGALMVCDGDRPVGIFTERDVMNRVILARKDPAHTRVEEAMTRDVVVIGADATTGEAMAVMTERRCRHLPVIVEGHLAGMVSIGDLVRQQSHNQQFHIRMLTNYIMGRYPG